MCAPVLGSVFVCERVAVVRMNGMRVLRLGDGGSDDNDGDGDGNTLYGVAMSAVTCITHEKHPSIMHERNVICSAYDFTTYISTHACVTAMTLYINRMTGNRGDCFRAFYYSGTDGALVRSDLHARLFIVGMFVAIRDLFMIDDAQCRGRRRT